MLTLYTLREVGEILVEALAPPCPKCGQQLGAIKGPHGWFWGCPAYPKCGGSATMNLARRARQEAERQSRIEDEAFAAAYEDRVYGSD